ncbi:MAG: hypothetical protein KY475_12625 [Planctomycetes bacterium]|nr:hypothetical protein [Planctomycetota bacterium]
MTSESHPGDAVEPPWRFSLADAFWWMVLAAAYFAVLAAFPVVFRSFEYDRQPPWPTAVTTSGCWLLLLGYYLRRPRFSVITVHTAPLILVIVVFMIAQDAAYARGAAMALAAAACGVAFSMPFHLAKEISQATLSQASPATRLWVNLGGAIVLTVLLISLIPSIALQAIFVPGVVFGALLGFWLGLYQAAATTPAIARARVLGLSVRGLAIGGFLGGLFGPLAHWIINTYGFGYVPLPMRFTPLYGAPIALLYGACYRRRE